MLWFIALNYDNNIQITNSSLNSEQLYVCWYCQEMIRIMHALYVFSKLFYSMSDGFWDVCI